MMKIFSQCILTIMQIGVKVTYRNHSPRFAIRVRGLQPMLLKGVFDLQVLVMAPYMRIQFKQEEYCRPCKDTRRTTLVIRSIWLKQGESLVIVKSLFFNLNFFHFYYLLLYNPVTICSRVLLYLLFALTNMLI